VLGGLRGCDKGEAALAFGTSWHDGPNSFPERELPDAEIVIS